jgi:hypothetical protein
MTTLDDVEKAVRDLDGLCKRAIDEPHNAALRRDLIAFLSPGWTSLSPSAGLAPSLEDLMAAAAPPAKRVRDFPSGGGVADFTECVEVLRGHLVALADEIVRQQQKTS